MGQASKQHKKATMSTVPQVEGPDEDTRLDAAMLSPRPAYQNTFYTGNMTLPNMSLIDVAQHSNQYEHSNAYGSNTASKDVRQAIGLKPFAPAGSGSMYNLDTGGDKTYKEVRFARGPRRHKVWGNLQQQNEKQIDAADSTPSHTGEDPSVQFSTDAIRPKTAPPVSENKPSNRDTVLLKIDDDEEDFRLVGKWRCCKCRLGHHMFICNNEEHPVKTLDCECIHRSCSECVLDSLEVKRYEPIHEPDVIRLSQDADHRIRFGVFCDGCGMSWRAQEVADNNKKMTAFQRISAMPMNMMKRGLHPLRHTRSWSNMSNPPRKSTDKAAPAPPVVSGSVFNLRQLSNEMEKGHGKQAAVTTVRFTGIKCTCTMVTSADCLCFQIVDPPPKIVVNEAPKDIVAVVKKSEAEQQQKMEKERVTEERKAPTFTSTPADVERGHGTPVLSLKGGRIRHANPLRSNPVTVANFM